MLQIDFVKVKKSLENAEPPGKNVFERFFHLGDTLFHFTLSIPTGFMPIFPLRNVEQFHCPIL